MDTSFAKLTNLAIAFADIQVSPQELARLNAKPVVPFSTTATNVSESAGYQVILTGYAAHVQQKERGTQDFFALTKLLNSLRSMPRPMDSLSLKGSVDTYSLSNQYYRADYRVSSGQVVVFNIQPITRLQRLRDAREKPALYHVIRDRSGVWRLSKKIGGVTTSYAAVNGQSNNLIKATWLMGSHLDYEFGADVGEYTLFHNPSIGGLGDTWESTRDKFGLTTDIAKRFSKTLVDTQAAGSATAWMAHSQGGVIFAEAVRYALNGNSSWALSRLKYDSSNRNKASKILDMQSVVFHGNANNNWRSKRLFERAGVKVVAVRGHDYDFVTNIVGMNTLNPRKLLGSVVYANHVFSGSVFQSPHTLSQSMPEWEQNMNSGPGKGRGAVQSAFSRAEKAIRAIKNYLP